MRATCALLLLAASVPAQSRLFTGYEGDELVRAFPALAGVHFTANQSELPGLIRTTAAATNRMLAGFPPVSASEQVRQLRFTDLGVADRTSSFRYVARYRLGSDGPELDEFRTINGSPARLPAPANDGYLLFSHFVSALHLFLPDFLDQSDFRHIGSITVEARVYALIAFAQRPASTLDLPLLPAPDGGATRLHGLAWVEASSGRIARLHLEPAVQSPASPFNALAADITFTAVHVPGIDGDSWIPAQATVHARASSGELHSIHHFSDYRLWDEELGPLNDSPGIAAAVKPSQDSYELLVSAIQLKSGNKTEEALAALRESVALAPAASLPKLHLALALNESGDVAGAETQLQAYVALRPENGPAHNLLGILLFKRAQFAEAARAFQASAGLQPKEAMIRFNLGQVLEKQGRTVEALAAYREACALDASNPTYCPRLRALEQKSATEVIRVEVRQVLVPVIVTDKEGHHVTGLAAGDFRLFEDGIEQKIVSFASGQSSLAGGTAAAPGNPASQVPSAPPVRRTFAVCIDTMHTAPANLARARAALEALFRDEQPGDAHYVLAALGSTSAILQNTTREPSLLLDALNERSFETRLAQSNRGSVENELRQFRGTLERVKRLCDEGDRSCPSMKRGLPSEADRIAAQARVYNLVFLRQLRDFAEQLSRFPGRRTLVLVSDGFDLVPGREAYDTLLAYFPEFRFAGLASMNRMQDEFQQIVRVASRADIAIHTIDARGLFTQNFFSAENSGSTASAAPQVMSAMDRSASASQSTLIEFAAATGGTAHYNSNDLRRGLTRAFADGRQYYLLAYVSSNATAGPTYRKISVRLRDQRLVVNAKQGYWPAG